MLVYLFCRRTFRSSSYILFIDASKCKPLSVKGLESKSQCDLRSALKNPTDMKCSSHIEMIIRTHRFFFLQNIWVHGAIGCQKEQAEVISINHSLNWIMCTQIICVLDKRHLKSPAKEIWDEPLLLLKSPTYRLKTFVMIGKTFPLHKKCSQ